MAKLGTIKVKLEWDGVKREVRYYYLCGIPVWKRVTWLTMPNTKAVKRAK